MIRRLAICFALLLAALAFSPLALAQSPGQAIQDCPHCPIMIVVPPGQFVMGSDKGHERESPPHPVTIPKPFAMARTEVTFDQWMACHTAGGCAKNPDDHAWGRGNRPVFNITWDEAAQYAAWLSKTTGKSYRLPSEAEWEYAARAGTTTDFPWGDDVGQNLVNCRRCGSEWGGRMTAPVGSFPPNSFGLYDLPGNVWEWVQDCWRPNYTGAGNSSSAFDQAGCSLRITRGGAWYYIPIQARASARTSNDHKMFSYTIGFRVVRDVE
ncbi:MAG: hypothetical protein A2516_09520 [Alphaproteobacteria bacterium RIFOXYD12_FULL_60_8]|nr:MAG: hypothetical protein A2516_09520 [Alphaproteobacteria bacterium RIFOXYD12_FULL_60_8]